jgi:hypothetical protein
MDWQRFLEGMVVAHLIGFVVALVITVFRGRA